MSFVFGFAAAVLAGLTTYAGVSLGLASPLASGLVAAVGTFALSWRSGLIRAVAAGLLAGCVSSLAPWAFSTILVPTWPVLGALVRESLVAAAGAGLVVALSARDAARARCAGATASADA